MPLYEVTSRGLERRNSARFATLEMYERQDLQRLLREEISALGEDLLVIAEEFGNWQDARRRIDLLALDRDGQLVVIEIKRTDDGGHMELQAIRYAAMVSSMGFSEVLEAYTAYCAQHRPDEDLDPRAELETFLESAEGSEEPVISSDVRIVLVSADFGREITTTVLWLNGFEGMDIRCVRLVPYEVEEKILLDIQQVIPLPEAADYQVRLRKKDAARERARRDGRDFTRYHIIVDGTELPEQNKRNAMRVMIDQLAKKGVPLEEIYSIVPKRMRVLAGRRQTTEEVEEAMKEADSRIDLRRWYTDHPFVDVEAGKTYVLSKMWGRQTGPKLAELAAAFPDSKVTFREAEPDAT
jgi:hypothetical protein